MVAFVLKPDLGSVFARALERGIGTVVGVVIGVIILAVVRDGLWLLIPFAVLAALLRYGRSRYYGPVVDVPIPLVVLLIDLLDRTGRPLPRPPDRHPAGCAIALVTGSAPGGEVVGRTCRTGSPRRLRMPRDRPNGHW